MVGEIPKSHRTIPETGKIERPKKGFVEIMRLTLIWQ